MEATILVIVGLIFVIIILALATAAIASSYNLLFEKHSAFRKKTKNSQKGFEGAKDILEEERLLLKEKLNQVIAQESGEFHKLLELSKDDALKLLTEIAGGAKDEIRSDLANFRQMLASKIDKEVQSTQEELKLYKEAKKKEIDAAAKSVISDVVRQVLPQSLDFKLQEDILIKSLERAKSDHFFES